ncbi:hypothetical protein Tco_0189513 [Tanacetum coccineum]
METEVESMVTVPIQQVSSSVPLLILQSSISHLLNQYLLPVKNHSLQLSPPTSALQQSSSVLEMYYNLPPRTVSPDPVAIVASRAVDPVGSPSSTTIDQDEQSTSTSPTNQEIQSQVTHQDKVALKEFDLKSALFKHMNKNKNANRNPANYHLYHALMEALIADEDAMDKEVAVKVKDHKRKKMTMMMKALQLDHTRVGQQREEDPNLPLLGSNEGTGNILGVPDESTVISRASSEGTGSKPGVPDEEKNPCHCPIQQVSSSFLYDTSSSDLSTQTITAPAHISSGPGPQLLTPRTISSGLIPQPPSPTPNVPPTKNDWDLLFCPMLDEYFNPSPSVVQHVLVVVVQEPIVSTGTPSSTRIDQDIPSTSTSQTTQEEQSHVIPTCVEEDIK